jgi:predicted dehydrogenase
MSKVKIAVIGLGYWGPNIVRNLLQISKVSNVYVCDIDKNRLNMIKREYSSVIPLNNPTEIFNNKEIDAVIVATPIKTHFALAKKTIISGKHVLIEKPITTSIKESKILINLSQKYKKIIMVGHTFVYSETVKKIKQIIGKRDFGKIYYLDSTRINLGLIQKDSDVIWDLAPHDLSIIKYLIPEKPISVQAFGSKFIGDKYELSHILIRFKNNVSAHINISWVSPVKIRSIIIAGSKKMIVWDDIEPSEKLKIYDKGVITTSVTPFSPAYRSGDVLIPKVEQKEALNTELNHFVDCIINKKNPLTSGIEGLEVVTLIEAIEKSLISHKEIIL